METSVEKHDALLRDASGVRGASGAGLERDLFANHGEALLVRSKYSGDDVEDVPNRRRSFVASV